MKYSDPNIIEARSKLLELIDSSPQTKPLKHLEFSKLVEALQTLPPADRATYGRQLNQLKQELEQHWQSRQVDNDSDLSSIDVTAPFADGCSGPPDLIDPSLGSRHPVMTAQDEIIDIFARMGFSAIEPRQIDDDYHMFESLNFPDDHPAKDEYDTFILKEKDSAGKNLLAPAHTSIMQNRILRSGVSQLEADEPIAVVVPGRVFRNEDLDARHEHTFYQIEGVYVDKNVTVGNLMATLKSFMSEYYQRSVDIKSQPFYFPFTEPSFEFAISCPFCQKQGCSVCGEGWIELLGCGMIHPNVLREAGVDPNKYSGFAFGIGFMRMVMIKYGIEDIRLFQSAKLEFLRQFK